MRHEIHTKYRLLLSINMSHADKVRCIYCIVSSLFILYYTFLQGVHTVRPQTVRQRKHPQANHVRPCKYVYYNRMCIFSIGNTSHSFLCETYLSL